MFDFHEKRKIRRILYSKPAIALLLLLIVWFSFGVYGRYVVSKEMSAKLDKKHEELKTLEERKASLESKVEYLQNERGLEEELRSRYDIAREGEQVIILLDSEEEIEEEHAVLPEKRSWFSKLMFWRE